VMQVEKLIDAARERTGLEEFDSESFREPLELMVAGIDARPERDKIASALSEEMINALANRLRVADYLRQHPELLDAPLVEPVIIMGMPRTGTTIISYCMDCDPRWRSLLNWEAVDSVPPPTTETLRTDPRCVAKKQLQEKILPNLPFAVPHWEWADGPTECIFVQAQDFKTLSWEARLASREYAEYLLTCNMSSAYEYEKKVLRILQSQAPGRWVLKMPSHALHFEWALRAFPDARFIWTHRNPYKALASLGTTIAIGHMVALGHVDKEFIHDVYPQQIAEHAKRPMRARPRLPKDKILDVYCAEFLRDPMAGMRQIYSWLGERLAEDVDGAMRAWLEEDDERQAKRPSYTLEDFGWSRDEVAPHFEEYLANYPQAVED
jgi:Sulfotransferase family